jgi:uncharacterized membrane protein HdeD (DUF308 family)
MTCPIPNENATDRVIRIVVGVISFILGIFVFTGFIQTIAYAVSVLGILTGLTGNCLLYRILGISTNKK